MPSVDEYPPHVLREYAVLADGERGALIGPRGDIAWMCAPHWDSDAVFSSLIGGGGVYAVTPHGRYTWGGYYERRSLIWNSRWVTTDAIIESREALAMPSDSDTAVILRRVRVIDGSARVETVLDLGARFGADSMTHIHVGDDGRWTGRSGALRFRWTGASDVHHGRGKPLRATRNLTKGDVWDLILEVSVAEPQSTPPDPDVSWTTTEASWHTAVPEIDGAVLGVRDAELSFAVLAGLTSTRGGMVAAATMNLPERAKHGRNYDYRYAWIRDQCYAGLAVAAHGHYPLLDSAVSFVSARLLDDGPDLTPAYTVRGDPVPDERTLPGLDGYPGGSDKIGNWVNQQFQLDVFGEALQLLAVASKHARLEPDHWGAIEVAVGAIEQRWGQPDAGIWEVDDQHWAHSRLACVAGLRAVAGQAPPAPSGRWSALADAILADVSADCLHPSGRWQRSPDDARVDGALLLPALRGALPPDDPRSLATVAAVEADLCREEYVYRFDPDGRPLGDAEGAFLLCGFLMALAKSSEGDQVAARGHFERNRAACGSPGLLSEEFDVGERQLRGNLPQAFVHAVLLECSATLGQAKDSQRP
jgi:GH15 family glucan-1,4-alpha-glucosidase